MRWLCLIALVGLLSGCVAVVIPFPESTSYEEALQRSLSQGEVSRSEVIEMIGEPDIERSNGAIWIYEQPRHLALGGGIVQGAGGWAWIDEYQFMVVEFQEDIVSHVERVEDAAGCTSTGICRPLWLARDPPVQTSRGSSTSSYSDSAVVESRRADDKLAKAFSSSPDLCSLYVYTRDDRSNLKIDSSLSVYLSETSYLHILLKPGMHILEGISHPWWVGDYEHESAELSIDCAAGDVIYVEVYMEGGFFRGQPRNVFVTSRDDVKQREILPRNLVISNVIDEIQARQ